MHFIRVLTNKGVCGAIIDPKRPIIEHNDKRLFRTFVGNISEVKKYSTWKLHVMANFPIRNKVNSVASPSEMGIHMSSD